MEKSLKKAGIKVMTSSEVTAVKQSASVNKVSVKNAKGTQELEATVVLSAVGITPNIENIGLEELGVKTERGHEVVDEADKTNIDGAYAIGDTVKGQVLANVASAE